MHVLLSVSSTLSRNLKFDCRFVNSVFFFVYKRFCFLVMALFDCLVFPTWRGGLAALGNEGQIIPVVQVHQM